MVVGRVNDGVCKLRLRLSWLRVAISLKFAGIILDAASWLYRRKMIGIYVMAQCLTLSSAMSRRGMTIWWSRRWIEENSE